MCDEKYGCRGILFFMKDGASQVSGAYEEGSCVLTTSDSISSDCDHFYQ